MSPTDLLDIDAAALPPAFGLCDSLTAHAGPWHTHSRHQLLYAASGSLRLITPSATWLLPPQRAAWLPAGTRHRTESPAAVALRTLYFQPDFSTFPQVETTVFAVTPLCRELLLHGMRHGPTQPPSAAAERFFGVVADLLHDWLEGALPYTLPTPSSPNVARAMAWAVEHLDQAELVSAAKQGGMAPRTFARKLQAETGSTWRSFITTARMLAAMQHLTADVESVTNIAFDVGYDSPAAFTYAFSRFCGMTPSAFRRQSRIAA